MSAAAIKSYHNVNFVGHKLLLQAQASEMLIYKMCGEFVKAMQTFFLIKYFNSNTKIINNQVIYKNHTFKQKKKS